MVTIRDGGTGVATSGLSTSVTTGGTSGRAEREGGTGSQSIRFESHYFTNPSDEEKTVTIRITAVDGAGNNTTVRQDFKVPPRSGKLTVGNISTSGQTLHTSPLPSGLDYYRKATWVITMHVDGQPKAGISVRVKMNRPGFPPEFSTQTTDGAGQVMFMTQGGPGEFKLEFREVTRPNAPIEFPTETSSIVVP